MIYFLLLLFPPLFAKMPPLVVGMELSYPPFETVDSKGHPTGISIDIVSALGVYLGRDIEVLDIPYLGLIPALKTKKIDLIVSSLTVTPRRERTIDFTNPYLEIGLSILVGKDSSIEDVEALNNPEKKVVVRRETSGHFFAKEHLSRANVIVLDKENSAVMELLQGKADAFIYDQLSIYNHWKKHESATKPLLSSFQKEYWAMGVRKEDSDLKERVNAFIADFRKRKGFDTLAEKYLKEAKKTFDDQGIPFIFN